MQREGGSRPCPDLPLANPVVNAPKATSIWRRSPLFIFFSAICSALRFYTAETRSSRSGEEAAAPERFGRERGAREM